jgi:hypothetical protein
MLEGRLNRIKEVQLKIIFKFFLLVYCISFLLPSLGSEKDNLLGYSDDNSIEILYGYQCFIFSYIMLISSLIEGAIFNFFCILLGCFSNSYLFVIGLVFYFKKGKLKHFLVHCLLLLISALSVVYWSSWV